MMDTNQDKPLWLNRLKTVNFDRYPFALWHNSKTGQLEITDTRKPDRQSRWSRQEYTLLTLCAKPPEITTSWTDHILRWDTKRVQNLWPFGPSQLDREALQLAGWRLISGKASRTCSNGYFRQLPNGKFEPILTRAALVVEITSKRKQNLYEVAIKDF